MTLIYIIGNKEAEEFWKKLGFKSVITVAGTSLKELETRTRLKQDSGLRVRAYPDESYSRFIFSVNIVRPILSSFFKSLLPVMVITTISLLTFFISLQNFSQRITLGVTTLLSASTFHLALLSGIPPTGYLTLADRMMLSIYAIFLYNLAVSVYVMKLVDAKKTDDAAKFNRKALKILPLIIILLALIQIIFF